MYYTFQCITCSKNFDNVRMGEYTCEDCGEQYEIADDYLRTSFDKKLFDSFRKDYLLNKTLNNNGYISYEMLGESSLSLQDRADVVRFRGFVEKNLRGKRIFDIGCGIMAIPGYLMFNTSHNYELIGLDPINNNNFVGLRIVGCSEFVPLPDNSIDTIIFATSLDHVCNLTKTIAEVSRLLGDKGRVLIWMSDRSTTPFERLKDWLRRRIRSWKLGYSVDKYYVYPNWTVLAVPSGGVDPFHSYPEVPEEIIALFGASGLSLCAEERHSNVEVFLAFEKVSA
jgi:ubiquinone/menaquinone biosynthesis C-methylase UbiE